MKRLRPLLALLAIVGLTIAVICLPVGDWMRGFLEWLSGIGFWGPLVLAAAYIPLTVLMIPGSIPTLGAGFAFGVLWGVVAVSIGSVLGSSAAFLIGRYLARDWVQERIADKPRLRAIDDAVGQEGFKICLLIRLSPAFPYNLMGYVFGGTRIRFRDHFFASWAGMLPGTILYVYLGSTARSLTDAAAGMQADGGALRWILLGVGLVLTIVVTVYVTRIAKRSIARLVPADPVGPVEASEPAV